MSETVTWSRATFLPNSFTEPPRQKPDFAQKAFVKKLLLILVVLLTANIAVASFFGILFPVGYFSGKSVPRIISDLMFVEGAALFFLGAILAFSYSRVSLNMKTLMILGASMIGISMGFGAFASYL